MVPDKQDRKNCEFAISPPTLHDGFRWHGLRVGLLGGSFNPAHTGHVHIAKLAMAKFGLDFVWWLVTPQNPLKDVAGMAPYDSRFETVERIIAPYPRFLATHLERQLSSNYTFQTLDRLKKNFPNTDFLWICGMDNAHIFHRWEKWQKILEIVPVTFIARPPARTLVKKSRVRMYKWKHKFQTSGRNTPLKTPAIYWLTSTKMMDISSTRIRENTPFYGV